MILVRFILSNQNTSTLNKIKSYKDSKLWVYYGANKK